MYISDQLYLLQITPIPFCETKYITFSSITPVSSICRRKDVSEIHAEAEIGPLLEKERTPSTGKDNGKTNQGMKAKHSSKVKFYK